MHNFSGVTVNQNVLSMTVAWIFSTAIIIPSPEIQPKIELTATLTKHQISVYALEYQSRIVFFQPK